MPVSVPESGDGLGPADAPGLGDGDAPGDAPGDGGAAAQLVQPVQSHPHKSKSSQVTAYPFTPLSYQ